MDSKPIRSHLLAKDLPALSSVEGDARFYRDLKATLERMAETAGPFEQNAKESPRPIETVKREHVGKSLAWSPDGRRILAVGRTFEEAERNAREAGYLLVAVGMAPSGRSIGA